MFSTRTGSQPVSMRAAPWALARAAAQPAMVPVMAALTAALLASGCSSKPSGTSTSYVWPGSTPYHVAAAPPVPAPRPEVEDDGREAQMPPPRRIRQEPDDPREPYSRNYGSVPARQAEAGASGRATGREPTTESHGTDARRRLASAVDAD